MSGGTSDIEGLPEFLRILKLDVYASEVTAWAMQMGAAFLDEIVEHAESLAEDINLKPLEKKRLLSRGQDVCAQCVGKRALSLMPAAKKQKTEEKAQGVANSIEEHAWRASEHLQQEYVPEWHPSQKCKDQLTAWKSLRSGFHQKGFEFKRQGSKVRNLSDDAIRSVKDVNDVGQGQPLFAEYAYEDWALLDLRIELHLMLHDALHTSTQKERGLSMSQLHACYLAYYDKPLPEKECNKSISELLETMADTIKRSEADIFSPVLPQAAALDDFIKLVEVQRRERKNWVEAGDECAEVHFKGKAIPPPLHTKPQTKKKESCRTQFDAQTERSNRGGTVASRISSLKQQILRNKTSEDVTGSTKSDPSSSSQSSQSQTPQSLKQHILHSKKTEDVAGSTKSSPASSPQSWQPHTPQAFEMEPSERQVLRAETVGHSVLQELFAWNAAPEAASTDREDALKTRIRKMLELAFHPQTGEAESSQALRNAQKLMRSHHLEEADILASVQGRGGGGFHGVKLTPVKPDQKMRRNHEFWSKALMVAVELSFDVGSFIKIERSQNADFVIFYGSRMATDLAAFAYCCATNRIDWMAGKRSMPSDEVFERDQQPAGKSFSEVFATCRGYVEWAKYSDKLLKDEGDQVKRFANYVRAWEDPVAWDQAYKEGMASKLMKQAKAVRKGELATSDALALNLKAVQQKMVEHLGLKLSTGKKLRGLDRCRQARQHGASDASAINLREQQIEEGSPLALLGTL